MRSIWKVQKVDKLGTGYQNALLADLVARPIGLHVIRRKQSNRAFEILKEKFYCSGGRKNVGEGYENWGLKIHPSKKAKGPDDLTEAAAPTGVSQST